MLRDLLGFYLARNCRMSALRRSYLIRDGEPTRSSTSPECQPTHGESASSNHLEQGQQDRNERGAQAH